MTNNLKEINDVQKIIDEILSLIDEAETKFNKARNWGFFDILGGGFITDLFKHSNLDSASDIMNKINYLLKDLQRELDEVVTPTDFSMNTNTFASFADFIFDGVLADAYMQSKIMSSLKELKNLRSTLLNIKSKLSNLSSNYYK
ncbi:MAG: hypothetical protein J6K22_08955 [Spirochaetaceae bacterium]|nr:hypothetical protein [Spirochaetaceae bacterium]